MAQKITKNGLNSISQEVFCPIVLCQNIQSKKKIDNLPIAFDVINNPFHKVHPGLESSTICFDGFLDRFEIVAKGSFKYYISQYLSDQLTLFRPGRADYPHLLLLVPPKFFTFQNHCIKAYF